jgi:hypothetical protein
MTTTPDEPTELELLHRLMTSSPPFTPLERAVELVVGGLPAALVDEVPLPSGGRLVGSQLTSHQGRLSELQVVLDVRGSTAEALRACERELRERGWDPVEDLPGPMHHGGFVSGAAGDTRMLRRGGQGPILWVAAGTIDETLTDLRVRLDWQMPRHLEERGGRGMQLPSLNRMPRLHPPKGVAMEPRGGAGGVGWFSSQVPHLRPPSSPAGKLCGPDGTVARPPSARSNLPTHRRRVPAQLASQLTHRDIAGHPQRDLLSLLQGQPRPRHGAPLMAAIHQIRSPRCVHRLKPAPASHTHGLRPDPHCRSQCTAGLVSEVRSVESEQQIRRSGGDPCHVTPSASAPPAQADIRRPRA